MRRNVIPIAIMVVFISTFLLGFSAIAGGIKERMKERLPVITALKAQGLVGEDNRGLLKFLKAEKPHRDVIDAENNDRLAVYKIIAERQNATPDLVGRQRAAQIAGNSASGTWVQDPGGKWRKVE
jgi:uncharacterized protein